MVCGVLENCAGPVLPGGVRGDHCMCHTCASDRRSASSQFYKRLTKTPNLAENTCSPLLLSLCRGLPLGAFIYADY